MVDWSGDRCPRGRYLEALKMNSRHADMSILEAVQTFARLAIILLMFEIVRVNMSERACFLMASKAGHFHNKAGLLSVASLHLGSGMPRISLNFSDWPRSDPRSELTVDFPEPRRLG